jgi:hypothetical protein
LAKQPFWVITFLRRFRQILSSFHFFGFCNSNYFFSEKVLQPCVQPPTWRTRSLYLSSPVTRWPSYTLRHWLPFSLPSTTCTAMVEVF